MRNAAGCQSGTMSGPAAAVRAILSVPDPELDYAAAKLGLDALVDPAAAPGAALAEIAQLARAAADLASPGRGEEARLRALGRLLYESGPWNGFRPFAYDHGDPLGTHIPNKLLSTYLSRRLGNCVSMPILHLILAERLGFDAALASAPCHIFLRVRLRDGRNLSLEATSGGHPARDAWYRENFPMSDRALASGLYMRTLSRRESVALMATTVLEQLLDERRHEEAIAVAAAILDHHPREATVMVAQAAAYGELLSALGARHPNPFLLPEHLRPRRLMLVERANSLLAAAAALGWEPEERIAA